MFFGFLLNNEQWKLIADSCKIAGLAQLAVVGWKAWVDKDLFTFYWSFGVAISFVVIGIVALSNLDDDTGG